MITKFNLIYIILDILIIKYEVLKFRFSRDEQVEIVNSITDQR